MTEVSKNGISPEEKVLSFFCQHALTFSTAESCTGGLIGERITALSGSSEIYFGGIISYTNDIKMKVLSVGKKTLEQYGAVSVQTALEMAEGVKKLTESDIAVSVTGIAGPTGGTTEKPVGTVCFAITNKNGTKTYRKQFGENKTREEIRALSADFALELVLEAGKEISYA